MVIYLLKFYLNPKLLEIILGGMIFLSGFTGGGLFTSANQLYIENKGMRKVGSGYAIDLFGSALSAILTTAILLPLLGIPHLILILFLLNLIFLGSLFVYVFKLKNSRL